MENRRRLSVVGQRKGTYADCVVEHQTEVKFYAVAPARFYRQTKRLCGGSHKSVDEVLFLPDRPGA